ARSLRTCGYPCADSMSARAQRCSLQMPDIRLQPIPALTCYLRRFSCVAGGVHIRTVRRLSQSSHSSPRYIAPTTMDTIPKVRLPTTSVQNSSGKSARVDHMLPLFLNLPRMIPLTACDNIRMPIGIHTMLMEGG